MFGLNDIFSSIANLLIGSTGTSGFSQGGVGGLFNPSNPLVGLFQLLSAAAASYVEGQKFNYLTDVESRQKSAADLALNPARYTQQVLARTQPLDANLQQSIMQPVNAQLAARGLLTAPGQTDYALAQALAPYNFQQQQRAIDQTNYALGLPFQLYAPNYPVFSASGGYAGPPTADPFGRQANQILGNPFSFGGGGGFGPAFNRGSGGFGGNLNFGGFNFP